MSSLLHTFTNALLVRHGAIVDARGEALDVVAPPALATHLGTDEYTRLVFAAEARPQGAGSASELSVDYDAPLIDRLGNLVDRLPRAAWLHCDAPAPRSVDASDAVNRAITLHNGVIRVMTSAPASLVRLGVVCHYELLADVREGGLTWVWITPDTRSVASMTRWPDVRQLADLAPVDASDRSRPMPPVPWPLAVAAMRTTLAPVVEGFLESLTRRRQRDADRLREYSRDIDQAIRAKLERRGLSDAVRRKERDRLDATNRSYRSRLADLAERYRLQVKLQPVCVLACAVPGLRIEARLMRRTAARAMHLSWNAVDHRLDTPCCDRCHGPTAAAWLCDERVHYLCAGCFAPCDACHKPFCRACHTSCRRCARDGR